jgi:hypothetical protein
MSIEHDSKIKAICELFNADSKGAHKWTACNGSITRDDGANIVFTKVYGKDQMTISGLDLKGSTIKKIGTLSHKSAEEVYKDLKRRLLPEYLPEYEEQRAAALKAEEAETKTLAAMKSVVCEFRLANNGCCSKIFFGGVGKASGKAESSGGSITVNLTGLSPEQLRIIVAAVHKY